MKRIAVILLLMATLMSGCAKSPADQPPIKPEAITETYLQASSKGDVETCFGLLADDFIFRQEPPGIKIVGKGEFKNLLDYGKIWHQQYSITSPIKADGDKVTFSAKVTRDDLLIAGLDYWNSDFELQIQEGKIKSWLSMPRSEDWKKITELTAGGLGIGITPAQQGMRIEKLAENSPAYDAGVRSGDIIIAVNRVNCSQMREGEIQLRIKGPVGSRVLLTIIHEGVNNPVDIEATRVSLEQLRY